MKIVIKIAEGFWLLKYSVKRLNLMTIMFLYPTDVSVCLYA